MKLRHHAGKLLELPAGVPETARPYYESCYHVVDAQAKLQVILDVLPEAANPPTSAIDALVNGSPDDYAATRGRVRDALTKLQAIADSIKNLPLEQVKEITED